uniref:PKD/REJ-like domain-containing protein n=1 Tax=Bicosoecida sp. CB-2014 TaxID=1486930 RepID=A0A7S1CMB0_9STRA
MSDDYARTGTGADSHDPSAVAVTFTIDSADAHYHDLAVPDGAINVYDEAFTGTFVVHETSVDEDSGATTYVVHADYGFTMRPKYGDHTVDISVVTDQAKAEDLIPDGSSDFSATLGVDTDWAVVSQARWATPDDIYAWFDGDNTYTFTVETTANTDFAGYAEWDEVPYVTSSMWINDIDVAAMTVVETGEADTDADTFVLEEWGTTTIQFDITFATPPVSAMTLTVTEEGSGSLISSHALTVYNSGVTVEEANFDDTFTVIVALPPDDHSEGATRTAELTIALTGPDNQFVDFGPLTYYAKIYDDDFTSVLGVSTDTAALAEGAVETVSLLFGFNPVETAVASFSATPRAYKLLDDTDAPAPADATLDVTTASLTAGDWDASTDVEITIGDDDRFYDGVVIAIDVSFAGDAGNADTYSYEGDLGPAFLTTLDDSGDVVSAVAAAETGGLNDGAQDIELFREVDTVSIPFTLGTEPLADVTVSITVASDASPPVFAVAAESLVFTAADYDTPQSFDISGRVVMHANDETLTLSYAVTSNDPSYDGLMADVATNSDTTVVLHSSSFIGTFAAADGAAFEVAEPTGTLDLVFGIATLPDAGVDFTLSTSSPVGAAQLITFSASTFTLGATPATWFDTFSMNLVAPSDDLNWVETNVQEVDIATDGATGYATFAAAPLEVLVVEDDVSEIVASWTGVSISVSESGTTDTIDFSLSSEPFDDVVVTLLQDPAGPPSDIAFSPPTLTFTAADWNTPQTVTVSAVDDDFDEVDDSETFAVLVDMASVGDANYIQAGVNIVDVDVADDDTAGVTLDTGDIPAELLEGESTTFELSLSSQPEFDDLIVDIVVTRTDPPLSTYAARSLRVLPSRMVFDAASWSTPRTISVYAIDDDFADPDTTFEVSFTFTTSDGVYAATAPDAFDVVTTDDDAHGAAAVLDDRPLDEALGESLTVTLLTTAVADDMVTAVAEASIDSHGVEPMDIPDVTMWAQGSTAPNPPLGASFDVYAPDDFFDSGAQPPQDITLTVVSDFAPLDGLVLPPFAIAPLDDDFAGIAVVSSASPEIIEATQTTSFTIVSSTRPIDNVEVTFTDDMPAGRVFFYPALSVMPALPSWSEPLTVTMASHVDHFARSPETVAVTAELDSGDASYDGQTSAPIDVAVIDYSFWSLAAVADAPFELVETGDAGVAGDPIDYDVIVGSEPFQDVTFAMAAPVGAGLPAPVNVGSDVTVAAADWLDHTPLQVSVTADNLDWADGYDEAITHTVSSTDADYDALTLDFVCHVVDDDVSAISASASSFTITEGDPDQTIGIVLDSEPFEDVTVTLDARWAVDDSPSNEVTITPSTLTFTAANWDTAQDVVVGFLDNDFTEPDDKELRVFAEGQSADAQYVLPDVPILDLYVTDDDVADLYVDDAGLADGDGIEGGLVASFSYKLSGRPLFGTVTVTTTITQTVPPAMVDVARTLVAVPSSIVITDGEDDWSEDHVVELRVLDDKLYDPDVVFEVSFSMVSNAPGYDVLYADSPSLFDALAFGYTTYDDDFGGVFAVADSLILVEDGPETINVVTGTTVFADAAAAATLTKQVSSPGMQDTSGVLVWPYELEMTSDAEALPTLSGSMTVRSIRNDNHVEDIEFDLGWVVSSSDSVVDGLVLPPFRIVDLDEDVGGIAIFGLPESITEGIEVVTLDSILASQPSVDVLSTYTFNRVSLFPSTLFFTPGEWDNVNTVAVLVPLDHVAAANEVATISVDLSSSDSEFDGVGTQTDTFVADANFVGAATIGAAPFELFEGADDGGDSADYHIILASEPQDDVRLEATGAAVEPASVDAVVPGDAFVDAYPGTWSDVIETSVSVTNDDRDWALSYTQRVDLVCVTTDAQYSGLTVARPVLVYDDDVSLVDTDTNSLTIEEGEDATFDVTLTSAPHATTHVDLSVQSAAGLVSEITLSAARLTFDDSNWDIAQTVTVTAENDDVDEPDASLVIDLVATSADGQYEAVSHAVSITHVDDDVAGLLLLSDGLAAGDFALGETSTADVGVALNSEPKADVVITLETTTVAGVDSTLSLSTATMTFTSVNWMTPQVVTITADNDDVDEPDVDLQFTAAAASGDPKYDADTTDLVVTFEDDDDWSVDFVDASGMLLNAVTTLAEGAERDVYVVLGSEPKDTVVIDVGIDLVVNIVSDITLSTDTLTFTEGDWATPQLITLTAIDDDVDEPNTAMLLWISSSSSDANYDAAGAHSDTIAVTFADDDIASLVVEQGVVVIEGSFVDDGEGTTVPTTLSLRLNSEPKADVAVTIAVDELANAVVRVSHIHDETSEEDGSIYFDGSEGEAGEWVNDGTSHVPALLPDEVRLHVNYEDTTPSYEVTVTFTASDWATPKLIYVWADDDNVDMKDSHEQRLLVTAASADPRYEGKASSSWVEVIDATRTAALDVFPASLTVVENGDAVTFRIFLFTKPVADVVVAVDRVAGTARADDVGLSADTLTFTPANWQVPQTVSVHGVDNDVQESTTRGMTLELTSVSDDPRYRAREFSIAVAVQEDDEAGVALSGEFFQVNEDDGATSATYGIALATKPSSLVIVTLTYDSAQLRVSPSSVTIQPDAWNVEKMVTVTAVMDGVTEASTHASYIGHSTISGDPRYSGHTWQQVEVLIGDELPEEPDRTPAPVLVSARLSETEHIVTITFDRASTRIGMSLGRDYRRLCKNTNIFKTATLGRFRNVNRGALDEQHDGGPFCYWQTSSILIVELEPNYYLAGGETVALRGGNIRSTPTSIVFSEGQVVLQGRTPPPTVTSALFGDIGAQIFVKFSGQTSGYVAGQTTAPCSLVFDEASQLGQGSECKWSSSSTLRILLGSGATIVPHADAANPLANGIGASCYANSRLTLKPNTVRAVRNGILYTSGCVTVARPLNPVLPKAVISAPTQVGSCDQLLLRSSLATGGGGRPMVRTWSWAAANAEGSVFAAEMDAIIAAANAAQSKSITIEREVLEPDAQIDFTLGMRNFLTDHVDSVTVRVVKKGLPIPSVEVQGAGYKLFKRDRVTTVMASARVPQCSDGEASTTRPLGYTWRHLSTTETTKSGGIHDDYPLVPFDPNHQAIVAAQQGGDAKVLRLPRSVLRIGHIVQLELTVFMVEDPEVNNLATFTFEVLPSDLQAGIVGGSRLVGSATPTVLDATDSWDPDGIADEAFRYAWACEDLTDLESGGEDGEGGDGSDDSDSDDEEEAPAKKPAKRARLSAAAKRAAAKEAADAQVDKERRELAESMLSKKAKRKYTSVMRAKARVAGNAAKLEEKRVAIEAKAKAKAGGAADGKAKAKKRGRGK